MLAPLWLYWLLVAVMLIGIAGSVIPAVPGISLIAIAIFVWGWVDGFREVWVPLIVSVVLLLVGIGIDFLATYYGAKRAGASRWGQIGAIVGLLVGFLGLLPTLPVGGPVVGILIGPVLGALMGEYLYRKDFRQAGKAAIGIVVGSLVGNVIQFLLAIFTVAVFLWTTLPQILYNPG